MNIGAINIRARIERPAVIGQDVDYGTDVLGWALVGVVWCNVQDELPSRSEAVKNGLAVTQQRTRVRMRYRQDLDSSMRLTIGGVIHEIVGGPAVLGDKDGIELFCSRYSTHG